MNNEIQEIRYQVGEAWKGTYNAGTTYGNANVVQDPTGLSVYRSLKPGNVGHPLTDTAWWFLIIDLSSIKEESDRIKALNDAIAADEAQRVENENGRVTAEQGRVDAENARVTAEQGRVTAEQQRVLAEQQRASQEQTRISQEQSRVTAEQGRVAAEAQRVQKEQLRENNEAQRVINETNRVSAEAERVEQYAADHQQAVADHDQYVDSLGAFDISAYHATGGVLAKYADLTAALGTGGANIPEAIRKGGMSVKFVQSSDNKYVQYRLTSDTFTTTESEWQKQGAEVSVSKNTQTGDDSLIVGSQALGRFADAGKLIKIEGFCSSLAEADLLISSVGQYFYNKVNNKIYRCIKKPMAFWADAEEIPFYDGAIYVYEGALYTYNNGFIGIELRGSYSNENDVKERGVYAQEDRGNGFGYGFLIVQKSDNTIVQFRLFIGVSILQPSITYRISTDNGTTWESWIDWVEQAYNPYTPKTRTIYKFLKSLGDTPNGGYYYNINTLKVYQNNSGYAVEITPREQDRYEFEGKQYIYTANGLTPLENAVLEISGYDDISSEKATNGTYYVVNKNLLYVVQAGINTVLIPWEKGRPYLYKGSLYFYNGSRLIREDNTGATQANPPSAKCISDSFIGKASCASRMTINDNGIAYIVYMCGSNTWYEANEKVVLSEFPINRPEMAKNYVVANYTDNGISGKLALPNIHLLPNGNVRVLFSNYQTSKELMTIFYKDFDISTKQFSSLNRLSYNGSPITFNTLETIVGTSLENSDGIHISGNLMNDFGVDGNGNPIKYFFINAGDGNPVVFSTIDDFESVQLVKVLPITDREYESALCKLGSTFYIYYRASSGSWLTTTTDWETFTTAVQFSTLNNRADIYCDGTKVYLCGANAETTDTNVFRRTNAHILVGTGATLDGYTEVQEIYDERGLVELNYIYLGNTHIIVCSSSPIMIDAQTYSVRYRGKYGIYFITIRDAMPCGLIR